MGRYLEDVTRRETVDGAEAAIDTSVDALQIKLEFHKDLRSLKRSNKPKLI